MFGLGTIANTLGIIIGGLIGVGFGNRLTERFQKILNIAMALSVSAMGAAGFISKMLTFDGEKFGTQGVYVIIFSLVLGGIIGELINIDEKMARFGAWLKLKTGNAKDARFIDGFVTASLTVCIGAMAVMGSIMDGIYGDHSILFTKSIMDMVILVVFTAALGKGCIFSAIPVFLFQGTVTVLSRFIAPFLNDLAMDNLSMVGSILILCIGINNFGMDEEHRIKVANLLPAIVFAVIAAFIPILNG